MKNQHHICILEANYYLSVYEVYFKVGFDLLSKTFYLIDPVLPLYTKV